MAKTSGYISPFHLLTLLFPFLEKARDWFDINVHKSPNFGLGHSGVSEQRENSKLNIILSGLNPLVGMGKDAVDTFKPYASPYYLYRDLMQPLRGLGNLFVGTFNIIATPFLLPIYIIKTSFGKDQLGIRNNFSDIIGNSVFLSAVAVSGIVNGISNIFRGVTQLIATPLTYFVKIPARTLFTSVKGAPSLEKKLALQINTLDRVESKKSTKNGLDCSLLKMEVHRRVVKGILRGERTDVNYPSLVENQSITHFSKQQHLDYARKVRSPDAPLDTVSRGAAFFAHMPENLRLKSCEIPEDPYLNCKSKSARKVSISVENCPPFSSAN